MSTVPPAIALRGVTKRYGANVALKPTDLEIAEGEFFCLLGPSGCGKTTTLNLIGGFIAPSEGEIFIRDQRVDRLPPHRRSVNTVFQSYALFPHMTVRDNVGFGLKMARIPARDAAGRIEEALGLVGLEAFGERLPSQLSGGQQQRVAVARALVNRPAVLLLDEPLGALDLKLRKRLQIELSQIHRDVGTTFVYVTHDQEEAMSMSTRIAVLSEGRIEQIGTPSEIYYRPNSRFVADFIGESNFLPVDTSRSTNGAVHLADGRAIPCNRRDWVGGAAATLMVRPESIHVAGPEGGPGASLTGRVVQTSFLGSQTRIAVRCDAVPAPITVSQFGRERLAAGDLAPDREVSLWWDPEDAVLLAEESTQEEGD
jgi:spermidine/putrescine ABC transporter ATP-binding subunit